MMAQIYKYFITIGLALMDKNLAVACFSLELADSLTVNRKMEKIKTNGIKIGS